MNYNKSFIRKNLIYFGQYSSICSHVFPHVTTLGYPQIF